MIAKHPQLAAAGLSDIGHGRTENQDAFHVDAAGGLFVVADGIGGHRGGGVAAQATVAGLRHLLNKTPKARIVRTTHWLRKAIRLLNASVFSQGARSDALRGMGSTLACLLIRNRTAYVANMGDSRVYLLRRRRLIRLTEDHTLTALLVREGEISAKDAATHPGRGHLTRYIGMGQDVNPDVSKVRVTAGDRFLLCTDGLWNVLRDAQIKGILLKDNNPQRVCSALVEASKNQGSQDNITCVMVMCGKTQTVQRRTRLRIG